MIRKNVYIDFLDILNIVIFNAIINVVFNFKVLYPKLMFGGLKIIDIEMFTNYAFIENVKKWKNNFLKVLS